MKRFLTVLFAVCFVLTAALCTTVQAADVDLSYAIGSAEGEVGDEIRVPVNVTIHTYSEVFALDVEFDSDILEFVAFETSSPFVTTKNKADEYHTEADLGLLETGVNFYPDCGPEAGEYLFVTLVFNIIAESDEPVELMGAVWGSGGVEEFTNGSVTIGAAPCTHANQTTTTVDADCDTEGSITVTCDDCGETVSTETIDALGCTAGEWLYDDEGHWTECIRCGEIVDAKAAHVEEGTCECGKEIVVIPVNYEIIDDQVYADGELVLGYQLVVVDGKTYFVGDYNKIVKGKAVYVNDAWLPFGADGALTTEAVVLPVSATTSYAFVNGARATTLYGTFETADAVYYIADGYCVAKNMEIWVNGTYWYFGADGAKATGTILVNDRVYVEGEWLRAYALVVIDGNTYKVSDYHKIAKNTSIYVNDGVHAAGYYAVGADGVIDFGA